MAKHYFRAGAAIGAVVLAAGKPDRVFGSLADDIGLSALRALIGAATPSGAHVPVSLVEAPVGTDEEIENGLGRYFPDVDGAEFVNTLFTDGSRKQSNGVSTHSHNMAQNFVGNFIGIARQATDVTIYEANDYLQNVVQYDAATIPTLQNSRVQNHSWVGSFEEEDAPVPSTPDTPHPDNILALQRFDYLTNVANDGAGMTAVVGVNNNLNPLPYLLAHSYNAISVGRSDGVHSIGLTQNAASYAYGPGRSKPEIVAPLGTTSGATSTVSGVAALIYEAVAGTDADNSETVKALLLAGAAKDQFPAWSRTPGQPLDDKFGAGEVDVLNSYLIQYGGRFAGTTSESLQTAAPYGWDYQDRKNEPFVGDMYYRFEVPDDAVALETSIVLAWNHPGELDAGPNYDPATDLQNLDLAFYDSTDLFLGELIDQSVSLVDNVEHIHFRDDPATPTFEGLLPGIYTLKVSGAGGWDYGLAWRTTTQRAEYDAMEQRLIPLIDADFDDDGSVDGGDFLIWQRHTNQFVNASHSQGDADGDGDVDADDLLGFHARLGPVPLASVPHGPRAIPEPCTWLLTSAAGVAALSRIRTLRKRCRFHLNSEAI